MVRVLIDLLFSLLVCCACWLLLLVDWFVRFVCFGLFALVDTVGGLVWFDVFVVCWVLFCFDDFAGFDLVCLVGLLLLDGFGVFWFGCFRLCSLIYFVLVFVVASALCWY